mgnify:FL=1
MTSPELRKIWKERFKEHVRQYDLWVEHNYRPEYRPNVSFPEQLRGLLACGAKTRAGTPCKRKDIYLNGRCKLHGGMSTGPKTPEGKARAALNGLKPKRKRSA